MDGPRGTRPIFLPVIVRGNCFWWNHLQYRTIYYLPTVRQGRRKHFRFGQAKYSGGVIPLGMLDWKMDWNGGLGYGMDYGIYITHSNTRLYYVAICLLTYS